ncbi:ARC6/PARC6 family protein [Capilliphycus salinus ALCB114379]|uniref:ARC6/PARC6 family protein n=1 Tax=Capilliphycus salinus TaxID=2768948 RepID=UPI0039A4BD96
MKPIIFALTLLLPLVWTEPIFAETSPRQHRQDLTCQNSILLAQNPALTLGEAADLVSEWLTAKSRIFAPPFDRRTLEQFTTGVLYRDTLKAIDFLIENDAYYEYGVQKVETVERFAASGNKATIEVRVTEDTTFYQNGQVKDSDFNTKRVRYKLEYWDGIWKIADFQVVD